MAINAEEKNGGISYVWPGLSWGHATTWLGIGSAPATAGDVRELKRAGFTHVLDLRAESEPIGALAEHFNVKHLPTADDSEHKGAEWFGPAVSWATQALYAPGTKIYIHCAAGIHRAPSMAYALLRALGYDYHAAFGAVKQARPIARLRYRKDADRWLYNLKTNASAPSTMTRTKTT